MAVGDGALGAWAALRDVFPSTEGQRCWVHKTASGSKNAALSMAFKLLTTAQEHWKRFNGYELITQVLDGVNFQDGIAATDDNTSTEEVFKDNEKVAA